SLICAACGRSFARLNAYSNHIGSCRAQKKRTASALEVAKEKYRNKKTRLNTTPAQPISSEPNQLTTVTDTIIEVNDVDSIDEDSVSLAKRRPQRKNRQLPKRYRNEQPVALASLPPVESSNPPQMPIHVPIADNPQLDILTSPTNKFGLFRKYFAISFPTHDPDAEVKVMELSEEESNCNKADIISHSLFKPYPNQNAFLLGEWYWNGGVQKTQEGFQKLIGIVSADSFNPADLQGISWNFLNKCLGESKESETESQWTDELDSGWTETAITLSIPFHKNTSNPGLFQYTFPPFRHRSIVSILKEKMLNQHDFQHFHLEPYELRWKRKDMPKTESTRVHGELYSSSAFLEAHKELQTAAGEPGCSLPRVLIGLMFGSDSTLLTSFGGSSLWPCYMYFGNESKYRRCRPTCNLCNHIAYFQKIPPEFKDFAALHWGGKGPSDAFLTHCQREFLHAQWKELLDDDFLEAYEHGVVIECCDGVKRRFYLRIFAYSADYPEKILFSTIRNLGNCPCPRCLISKSHAHELGTKRDKKQRINHARVDDLHYRVKISSARDIIYTSKRSVSSKAVEDFLKTQSLVPTENAFSERLSCFGFNFFAIFLVDFMHEFELGVWKKVFIHLLRMLECVPGATNELDRRFRSIPTFGRDSIRRFSSSVSELKQLGARDYENLLQCAIPVFDGLLPKADNSKLMDVLFVLAHWHALAKLRQHTDLSLDILESVTDHLGKVLRDFQMKTCAAYDTRELKREMAARIQKAKKTKTSSAKPMPKTSSASRLPKTLNLNTYKDHALGDYVESIRQYGTTDSYSTEMIELEHRSPKSRYLRTNRKDFEKQIGFIERRQARIRRIRQKLDNRNKTQKVLVHEKGPKSWDSEYHIGKTQNHPLDLRVFVEEKRYDPAAKDFMKNLKVHLLSRIHAQLQVNISNLGIEGTNPSLMAQSTVIIKDNRIYQHKLARFYHTTYDVRRSEDVINPGTSHCNIMLLSNHLTPNEVNIDATASHPFLYARVIGVYHANVVYTGPGMKGYEAMHFDFLHVRWFQLKAGEPETRRSHPKGWASLRLDCLSFPPMAHEDSFGFVDPTLVLRSCHLIPAFSVGKRYLDGTGFSRMSRDENDWKVYYVNRFADRDMVMRYHWGLGIGHMYS
ncbi:hypothetical protein HYPSUDRAFT_94104, partial [Hypholoma sublateritium FD-334 SS-4]